MKLFKKWEKGLGKTRSDVLGKLSRIFKGKHRIDEALLEELETVLIEGDVGVDTAMEVIEDIRNEVFESDNDIELKVRAILKSKIRSLFQDSQSIPVFQSEAIPYVILVIGVNGTGKTTTIGKLAYHFKQQGKRVLLAAADTFRAAATEQLDIWAKRVGVDIIKQDMGADPASVAFDALDAALARNVDVLIVDTAGRLHTQTNLMEELKKIRRVLHKRMEHAPHEVLLILDATTGQNGLSQAKLFSEAVGIDNVVLTKLDGTARGGIVIAIRKQLGIPVKWVGLGEKMEDLVLFDSEAFMDGMLG